MKILINDINKECSSYRIRNARINRQMSQLQLANEMNVQYSFIAHLEDGTRTPSWATIRKLSIALRISSDYLLDLSDDLKWKGK